MSGGIWHGGYCPGLFVRGYLSGGICPGVFFTETVNHYVESYDKNVEFHFHLLIYCSSAYVYRISTITKFSFTQQKHNFQIIIIITFIRINKYRYRVHIKHLSTNDVKIFRKKIYR